MSGGSSSEPDRSRKKKSAQPHGNYGNRKVGAAEQSWEREEGRIKERKGRQGRQECLPFSIISVLSVQFINT